MSVDSDTVRQIAHLARISIDEKNVQSYADEMSGVLELAAQMNNIDTDGVEPMAHPLHAVQRLRDDKATEIDRREAFQEIAPAVEGGLYLVPQVIE